VGSSAMSRDGLHASAMAIIALCLLAKPLTKINAKIIGTPAEVIDEAEDREKFSEFIKRLGLNQPENGTAFTKEEAFEIANRIGYPVLVRPSYVLGGRAMRIVYNDAELAEYMNEAVKVSEDSPVLIDKFLDRAIELDVDAISDTKDVYIGGIMQHIEEAGIHSGDSACSLPTVSISEEKIKEIENATKEIALKLGVKGLLNIQYALHRDKLYLIEVNPRASRTVPFVSKATGLPLAKVATRVMWNLAYNPDINNGKVLVEALKFYDKFNVLTYDGNVYKPKVHSHIAVKEAVFPFNKLPGADLILGPEMKSTGEVMGISASFGESFAKSQLAVKFNLPKNGKVFISLTDLDKEFAPKLAAELRKLGFDIVATTGTYKVIKDAGIEATRVLKISEGRPNIVDMIKNEEIALVINTSDNKASRDDAKIIRREVLNNGIPYFTTIAAAFAAVDAIEFFHLLELQ
jgi:carbamoyl-phosphate synthase large subunit